MQSLLNIINKIEKAELKRINKIQSFSEADIVLTLSGDYKNQRGKVLGLSRKGGSIIVEYDDKKRVAYSFNKSFKENISFLKIIRKKKLLEQQSFKVQFISFANNPGKIDIAINGKQYSGYCEENVMREFKKRLLKNQGMALAYLKKNCKLEKI